MNYLYRYTDKRGGLVKIDHPMRDDAKTEWKGRPVKRVIEGGTGFVLKGPGFYKNDYK